MKIILENIEYKGRVVDHWEAELPQIKKIDDISGEKLIEYICDSLHVLLEE